MESSRDFAQSVRDAPLFGHLIMLMTVCIWLIKACWLDFIPALSSILVGLGHIVDGVLSAIVAGYVFYILFAIYPDYRQKRVLAPFVSGRVKSIVGDCLAVINEIAAASGNDILFKSAGEKTVTNAFRATTTTTRPNITYDNGSAMTWPAYFSFQSRRTTRAIDELFQQGHYLDAEVVALLTEVRDAPFFHMSMAAGAGPISNPDLSAWAPSFYRYLHTCRRLARWHDDHRFVGVPPLLPDLR